MKKFGTMEEAVEYAATCCVSWTDATSADNRYNADEMAGLAEIEDSENPLDEDEDEGSFFAVSPTGAIGISDDGGDINWLFISDNAPNEDFPSQFTAAPQAKFCSKCGTPVVPGTRFCAKCGEQLG